MRSRFSQVIEIRPRPRRWLFLYWAVLLLLVVCALQGVDIAWQPVALLAAGAVTGMAPGLPARMAPLNPDYVTRACLQSSGAWQLELGQGTLIAGSLRYCWGDRYGPLMALEWACEDGNYRQAWLTALDVPPAEWRRLRVRLSLA